ncbi:bifunctional 2-polyprenyl-6-hydroxyphenol methylase/3-demethylubiquinol 3-O-methyltransferase UbiG [Occultella aeris]|uniref:Tellurite resistance protein TehB n=1 Tax=Occultella aeris TaxID=2761496 RepID=A0A7M4DEU3_9MICO|nr:class I SAM-dependent methyltransferase [Occultella aeris]VZO35436.1 tellurite resistance protein TehB [Occultella aeris]
MDQAVWDEIYAERNWSGAVNGALAVEAADLEPGRVLDVGSGEGGDALWLAARGWRVTATDISPVALERAAASVTAEHGDRIEWVHVDLTAEVPEPGGYDLVSLMYFPLLRSQGLTAVRGLTDAVAPGGLFLMVAHDLGAPADQPAAGHGHGHNHNHNHGAPAGIGADGGTTPSRQWRGPDPGEFLRPEEFAATLDEGWQVETLETRPRVVPTSGAGVGHVDDVVLRARRTA